MKTARRVLSIVLTVLMIVGTCAIAASAFETLQAEINAAAPGSTVTMTKNTTETIEIKKNLTLDLGGYQLTSEYGKAAIKISGGAEVTVTNGLVESLYAQVDSMTMLQNVGKNSPAAITIRGGKLTVDGLRIMGANTRVPTTPMNDPTLFPTGSGIMSYDGAEVTIKRTSIYGDYGVNNKVMNNQPGADPVIEDAIILAITKAVKGDYDVADGSEEIIAADRIAGVLNSNVLDATDKEMIGNLLNERTLIVVKTPDTLIEEKNAAANANIEDPDDYVDYTPTITVTPGKSTADVNAPDIDYCWPNTKGTDCSYKFVAEGVKMSDGTIVALDKVPTDQPLDDCQIFYRVYFKMSDDAKPYILMLNKTGEENPLDGAVAWLADELNSTYRVYYKGKTNNNKIDTIPEITEALADLMWKVDNAGSATVSFKSGDETVTMMVNDIPEYNTLRQTLYRIFGKTAYEASAERVADPSYPEEGFDALTYQNIFGEPMPAADEDGYVIVGTVDRIQKLLDQLDEIVDGSFLNTDKWGDVIYWLVDEVYPELNPNNPNNILKVALDQIADLQALLNTSPYNAIVNAAGGAADVNGLFQQALDMAQPAYDALAAVLRDNADVNYAIDYVLSHKAEITDKVNTYVNMLKDWRTYVTPSKFIVDDTYVKTFSMIGSQNVDVKEPAGKLEIVISGSGSVAFSGGTAYDGNTGDLDEYAVDFDGSFELTAIPEDDSVEFVYWANVENGNRILSTEPTFRMTTNASRKIEAVFNNKGDRTVYFTNPTGDICGKTTTFDANGAKFANVKNPAISGFGFEKWKGASGNYITADNFTDGNANLTAYAAGNSAFASPNSYYGQEGAVLLVRPGSSCYIVTPVFSTSGSYTLTFYDAGEVYTATGTYSDLVTMESNYPGNAYWKIAGTDKIIGVNKEIRHIITDNASFESVQGACPVYATANVTKREADGKVYFNVERSTSKQIATTGLIWHTVSTADDTFDPDTDLVLNGAGVKKGTAKYNTPEDLYTVNFSISAIAGRTMYLAPFIEFTDGTQTYVGDWIRYN